MLLCIIISSIFNLKRRIRMLFEFNWFISRTLFSLFFRSLKPFASLFVVEQTFKSFDILWIFGSFSDIWINIGSCSISKQRFIIHFIFIITSKTGVNTALLIEKSLVEHDLFRNGGLGLPQSHCFRNISFQISDLFSFFVSGVFKSHSSF